MPPLRPNTLAEALDILARPMLVQMTAGGGPPPYRHPHALLMDTGRVMAMSGVQAAGGTLFIGANNTYNAIYRSQVLNQRAACLTDVCRRLENRHPGGVLLHDLTAEKAPHDFVLALEALQARVEVARRSGQGSPQRIRLPLRAFQRAIATEQIPLGIHFPAPPAFSGSALYCEDDLGVLQPDVQCAAALVTLSQETGLIETARLSFVTPGLWPFTCQQATAALIAQTPTKEAIEAVVRLAQRNCPQPRASVPQFSLALSSHLIRKTLDRAIARSQPASPSGGVIWG